jgi:hypothetical protein
LLTLSRITQYKRERDLSYVFVAYTAEQFQSADDLRALHQIADAAARNAGVAAYWVGCSCMPDPNELTQDVYRICDIIRVSFQRLIMDFSSSSHHIQGAQSLVIAVSQPPNDTRGISTTDLMLQQ